MTDFQMNLYNDSGKDLDKDIFYWWKNLNSKYKLNFRRPIYYSTIIDLYNKYASSADEKWVTSFFVARKVLDMHSNDDVKKVLVNCMSGEYIYPIKNITDLEGYEEIRGGEE